MKPQDLERFMKFVAIQNKHPFCWIWLSATKGKGYGAFWLDGKNVSAHKAIYEHYKGKVSASHLQICHKCDNPACVNPAHLILGTQKDNSTDSVMKGRWATQKLTQQQVIQIQQRLSEGASQQTVATEFGVSQPTISAIATGKQWRQLCQN